MRGEAEMTSNSTEDSDRPQSMISYSHYSQMPQGSPSDANAAWSQLDSNTTMFGATVKEEPVEDSRNDSGLSASMSPVSDKSDNHPSTSSPPNGFSPDDENIRVPKINSHGKIKTFSCKQCDFVALTKLDYWEHAHVHIKEDKLLKCPRCPFVTEYKHHLEYHLMNHSGTKPFKCEHCDYSCVNKSMLNSHLKSHSKVYQYRCADCNYETKYCHSLKLHLRKYMHKPAMVLNLDGTPNPLPIIDVYGTRRGPKVKKLSSSSSAANSMPLPNSAPLVEASSAQIQQMQQQLPQMQKLPQMPQIPQMQLNPLMSPLLNQNSMLPIPPPWLTTFPTGLPPSEFIFNLQNFQNLLRDQLEHLNNLNKNQSPEQPEPQQDGALDLTNKSNNTSENGDDMEDTMTTAFDNVEVVENRPVESQDLSEASENRSEAGDSTASGKFDFPCQYCGISFGDEVLFRIHIGYHGFSDPFTCNMCGEKCGNKVNFYLHIARVAH